MKLLTIFRLIKNIPKTSWGSKKAANKYLFKSRKALKEFENFLEKVNQKTK